jgi:hypothetical protein
MTEEKAKKSKVKGKRVALKDHVLHQNDSHFDIKKGDDLDKLKVPQEFNQVLITEEVLKG